MRNATMAMLLGICAACSNQTATSPASPPAAAKQPPTAPDGSRVTTAPRPSTDPATTWGGTTPSSPGSGIMVLNQFDTPVPVQVSR
jgi:hypothetical protein